MATAAIAGPPAPACSAPWRNGPPRAQTWWRNNIAEIEKIRGKLATDKLREAMNNVRHNLQR